MQVKSLTSDILSAIVKLNKKECLEGLTGEMELTISKADLIERMARLNPAYLSIMQDEWTLLVQHRLFYGYISNGITMFDIPDWDRFLSAVNAYHMADRLSSW